MEQERSEGDAALERVLANLEEIYAQLCFGASFHEREVDAEREDDGDSLSFLPPLVATERPDDESELERVTRLIEVVVDFAGVRHRIIAEVEDEV